MSDGESRVGGEGKKKRVAVVVLAAGASTRMKNTPKQLLPWGPPGAEKPLLGHVVDTALESGAGPVIVVLGSGAEEIRRGARLDEKRVRVVVNERWPEGQSTSVIAGVSALPGEVDAVIMLLVDQPLVEAWLLDALIREYESGDFLLVIPFGGGRRGNPVLFDRRLFGEMLALSGDEGARGILGRHHDRAKLLELAGAEFFADVDTLEEYESLRGRALRHSTKLA